MLLKVSSAFERGFATGFREKKKADQYFHLEITSFGAKTGDLGGKKTKKKNGLIEKNDIKCSRSNDTADRSDKPKTKNKL